MTFAIHLVSDATGETIGMLSRACLAQFEGVETREYVWSMIKNQRQLAPALKTIGESRGLVLYTFVDEDLRLSLEDFCRHQNIPCISALKPILHGMSALFNKSPCYLPGKQHSLDAGYFRRIEAMEYAIAQDDGHGFEHLRQADVIILGVSRTSKTPTCLYLAGRGIRAANIPFVPGVAMPDLTGISDALIVGLTKDPESLIAIRRNRLSALNDDKDGAYVDPEKVRTEVLQARRFFSQLECPVIDVTRRSIEETAAEIMRLLNLIKSF